MTNQIIKTTINLWQTGRRTKQNSSDWISGNAVCCIYNGESSDTRSRAGFIINNESAISYSCFNCKFKASYQAGRPISYKFRKLLQWLGADENTIRQLVIEAIRVREFMAVTDPTLLPSSEPVTYKIRPLPEGAQTFMAWAEFYELANSHEYPKQFIDAVQYISGRDIDMQKYEFLWTPELEHKHNYRVVIPFKWHNQIIGYSARAIVDGIKPKYYTEHEPNFVFNIDQQHKDSKFVIVSEGPFDAMSIDGVAVLSNECSEKQADIIDELGREVIVVPDFDQHINKHGKKVWPGANLIDQAIEYGWSVSFPVWSTECKDINDAVVKFGKLFVLKSIIDGKQHNKLKIELLKRRAFNE